MCFCLARVIVIGTRDYLKFKQLFCESSKRQLINLCQFINIINKECPIIY